MMLEYADGHPENLLSMLEAITGSNVGAAESERDFWRDELDALRKFHLKARPLLSGAPAPATERLPLFPAL